MLLGICIFSPFVFEIARQVCYCLPFIQILNGTQHNLNICYNLKIEIVVNWKTNFVIKPRKKITYLKLIQKPKARNFKIISGSLAI